MSSEESLTQHLSPESLINVVVTELQLRNFILFTHGKHKVLLQNQENKAV